MDMSISRKVGENLELYHPLILPQHGSRLVAKMNRALFRISLKRFLRRRDFRPAVLWLTHPNQVDCLGRLPADFVCYDCVDNWPSFFDDRRRKEIREKETRLLSRADMVLVTSRVLQKRIEKRTRNVYLVPNGVETEHFSSAIGGNLLVPEDIRALQKPLIGYMGSVAGWLDFDLILHAADVRRDYNFIFIGPLGGIKSADYNHVRNLHFLGSKPYDILPNYLKRMDVMILPFKVNELTRSVDPVKAYEYLAAGKQVVATDMPELHKFEDLVRIAGNRDQFVKLLDACLQDIASGKHDPQVRLKRIANHTWTRRGEDVERLLARHMRGNP